MWRSSGWIKEKNGKVCFVPLQFVESYNKDGKPNFIKKGNKKELIHIKKKEVEAAKKNFHIYKVSRKDEGEKNIPVSIKEITHNG